MTEVIKNKVTLIIAGVLLMCGLTFMSTPAHAVDTQLNIQKNANCGSGSTNDQISLGPSGGAGCAKPSGSTDLENLIKTIINIFSAVVGAVAVIMLIVGGFRYITSGGDSNNVGAAKNTILYAIVGLVIVAVAQIIVQFVLERTTT